MDADLKLHSQKQGSQYLQSSSPPVYCVFHARFSTCWSDLQAFKTGTNHTKTFQKVICATYSTSLLTQLEKELRLPLLPHFSHMIFISDYSKIAKEQSKQSPH